MSAHLESGMQTPSTGQPQGPGSDIHEADLEKKLTQHENPSGEFKRPMGTLAWIFVSIGLYLSCFLYGLDTTIAADVQGPILASLGEIEKLAWVGIGFPMGSVSVILLIGNLFGNFDYKILFIVHLLLFEIGSAICGAAPNMNAMICGRVIAGIGGAGIYLGSLNYFAVFTSIKERSLYNAGIGLTWGVGCILGPVIGGAFSVSSATWRWAFYINLPLAAVTAPIYLFMLPSFNPNPELSGWAKTKLIDWVGAFLNAGTFVFFMVVLTFAGSTYAWNSATPIALWVVFGVFLIAYALQATFSIFTTPERRLFPVQFLRSRALVLHYIVTSSTAAALFVSIYYVPLLFVFTKGDDAIQAAVRLLPFICINVFFTMFSGAVFPIFGRYMPWYFPSGIFVLVGGVLMFLISPATPTGNIYGFEVLIAAGAGMVQQLSYSIAASKVKPHEVPAAIGFINVAQIGSIAIGLAISGSVFQNVGFANLQSALAAYNFSEADLRSALAGAQSVVLHQTDPAVATLAIGAIVKTIAHIFALVITSGAVTLVAAGLMSPEKLQLTPAAG